MGVVKIKALKDVSLRKGVRVILRADFDVAIRGGRIEDDFRIKEVLPTIRYLLRRGSSLRVISHLKRPGGRIVPDLSFKATAVYLAKVLKRQVVFISDPLNRNVFVKYDNSSQLLFFENIRFWPGEEKNSMVFARRLARWGDIYVNEAFANSHRAHASMAALPQLLPAFAGLYLAKEISALRRVIRNPRRPLVAILGGVKLETKVPLVERFLKVGGRVLVGGALANTIFRARGINFGKSPVDEEFLKTPKGHYLDSPRLFLPVDLVVARDFGSRPRIVTSDDIGDNEFNCDIGPATVRLFNSLLKGANTVVWNGPLGLVEKEKFSSGTLGIVRGLKKIKAFKVTGGGDTVAFLRKHKLIEGFDHISTGGGAMLEFLAGKKLPAIEALKTKK